MNPKKLLLTCFLAFAFLSMESPERPIPSLETVYYYAYYKVQWIEYADQDPRKQVIYHFYSDVHQLDEDCLDENRRDLEDQVIENLEYQFPDLMKKKGWQKVLDRAPGSREMVYINTSDSESGADRDRRNAITKTRDEIEKDNDTFNIPGELKTFYFKPDVRCN